MALPAVERGDALALDSSASNPLPIKSPAASTSAKKKTTIAAFGSASPGNAKV